MLKRVVYFTYRWINMVLLLYTTYNRVDLAHHEIFRAKVDMTGIKENILS